MISREEQDQIVARQVSIAEYIVTATAAHAAQAGTRTDEELDNILLGAYTALWCVLFQGPGKDPDFPEGDRNPQEEVRARLNELGISVAPKRPTS